MTKTQKRKKPQKTQMSVFEQNRKKKMEIFSFCVINFEPSISKTCKAPQNDRQNLSFVKDEHT